MVDYLSNKVSSELIVQIRSSFRRADLRLDKLVSREMRPLMLGRAARYTVESGGKRIRPLLTLLACKASGGLDSQAIPVMVTSELLHTVGLIHDDMIDQGNLRRGRPALHSRFGMPMAILAADLLFSKAFESLVTDSADLSAEKVVSIMRLYCSTCERACVGEALDIESPSESKFLEVARRKTGELFRSSALAGALVAGADRKTMKALGSFGEKLGIAYQLLDDCLDAGQPSREGRISSTPTSSSGSIPLERFPGRNSSHQIDFSKVFQSAATSAPLLARKKKLLFEYSRKADHSLLSLADTPERLALSLMSRFIVEKAGSNAIQTAREDLDVPALDSV